MVSPTIRSDARGSVRFVWDARIWDVRGLPSLLAFETHIESRQWSLRGLHCQFSVPQGKLVRCLSGLVFDVAVDLRPNSQSFGVWVARELRGDSGIALWIPPGFGHGILALSSEGALVSIQSSAAPALGEERTLAWDDPETAIAWPLPAGVRPTLSERDSAGEPLQSFRK